MGPGNAIENFYTNPATKDAYKTWVRHFPVVMVHETRLKAAYCAFAGLHSLRSHYMTL